MSRYKFKFIDLFAGIGGFHQAMTLYGGQCVFASEIDKECQKQYHKQFKIKPFGDINDYVDKIPQFDVLCGGFPCQTFSKAGNQEGFDDELKGQLFFRIVDILKLHPECKFILLENVRNLADQTHFWEVIQNELRELDFFITQEPIILSPDNFGIPQNRERVYILGVKKSLRDVEKLKNGWIHKDDLNFNNDYKKCLDGTAFKILDFNNKINCNYIISNNEKKVIKAWEIFKRFIIPDRQIGAPIWLDYFGIDYSENETEVFYNECGYYQQLVKAKKKDYEDEKYKDLIDENGMILKQTPEWKKKFIQRNRQLYLENKEIIDLWYNKFSLVLTNKVYRKFEWNCGARYKSFKKCIIQFRQSGLRVKKADTFPSLVAIVNTPIVWDGELKSYRRVTVREAANLQSFRANYNFICDNHISYKQLGNSVNVKVIKIIARELFKLGIEGWDLNAED